MRVPANRSIAPLTWDRGEGIVLPLLAIMCLVVNAGCTPSSALSNKDLLPDSPKDNRERVLVMPVDIELSELTAGGLLEPNAAWTATAKAHVDSALEAMLEGEHTATPIRYRPANPGVIFNDEDLQVVKLHEAIGNTILLHKYIPASSLPTKKGKFDWSLGPQVAVLQRAYQAEYAVFIHLRDSFASGGRVAAMVIVAALWGQALQGGTQSGFVSLVDLRTGDVIWFNRLVRGVGDLRDREGAEEALQLLFEGFPL